MYYYINPWEKGRIVNENIERNANAVQSHFYLSGQKCVKDHKYLELFVVLTNIFRPSLFQNKIWYVVVFFSYWFRTEHKQCSLRLDSSTLWFTPQKYNSSWRNHYIGEKKLCNTIVINYCFALDFIGNISTARQTPWQIIFRAII